MTRLICRAFGHPLIVTVTRGRYHARGCWCESRSVIWRSP